MPIDIVIPLGKGSRWKNNEIRFALRSIEKHVKNYRDIYIVGVLPHWMTGVKHYSHEDKHNHERNIYEKIKFACNLHSLSDNFLFMNDDHFITKDVDAENYPYLYSQTLDEKVRGRGGKNNWRGAGDPYTISIRNTRNALQGHPQKYFDIHTPIIYNKAEFIRVMSLVNWNIGMGYVIKSLYANFLNIEGEQGKDIKIANPNYKEIKRRIEGSNVFSISDSAIGQGLKKVLHELYPTTSKNEAVQLETMTMTTVIKPTIQQPTGRTFNGARDGVYISHQIATEI